MLLTGGANVGGDALHDARPLVIATLFNGTRACWASGPKATSA